MDGRLYARRLYSVDRCGGLPVAGPVADAVFVGMAIARVGIGLLYIVGGAELLYIVGGAAGATIS